MTDAEIIRHLAEKVMGWKVYPLSVRGYSDRLHEHRLIENVEHNWNYFPPGNPGKLWNPVHSIAEAFQAQNNLNSDQCKRYMSALESQWQECPCDCPWDGWLISANAFQRCIAMVEATK